MKLLPSRESATRSSKSDRSARQVLDRFAASLDYPMFVVTVRRHRRQDGCLIGFATQTSIDPPRLLVCLSRSNATTRTARRARYLGVHQLTGQQIDLARVFGAESGDWTDKFTDVAWYAGPHRVPLLGDAPTWLVGRVVKRFDVGDHRGFLLEPAASGDQHSESVLTFRAVASMDPGHPA